eukprot:scaffold185303_cov16-Tisochrysis_lutea.AAC.2
MSREFPPPQSYRTERVSFLFARSGYRPQCFRSAALVGRYNKARLAFDCFDCKSVKAFCSAAWLPLVGGGNMCH